jgi:glycerate kinase
MLALNVASPPPTAGPLPRVLVAMDKFKGTLTSQQAAEALTRGMARRHFLSNVTIVPLADGGDGTVDAAVSAGYHRIPFTVTGPTGNPLKAEVALWEHTAVVEVADICGLRRLPGNTAAPLHASSVGVGELLLGLADQGVRSVVLGLGGSATTDGGTGMLSALGVRFLDKDGIPIRPGGGDLVRLASIDWDGVDLRVFLLDIAVACDVESPLLGKTGAAHMFGPQKGADANMVAILEEGLANLARVVEAFPPPAGTAPVQLLAAEAGAGAAGGLGFGARLLNARFTSGSDFVLDLLDVRRLLKETDLVITGEGRLDYQSLQGKGPVAIARLAEEAGVPAVAVVGQNLIRFSDLPLASLRTVWAMSDVNGDTAANPVLSCEVLGLIGEQIAEALISQPHEGWNQMQHTVHSKLCSA